MNINYSSASCIPHHEYIDRRGAVIRENYVYICFPKCKVYNFTAPNVYHHITVNEINLK